MKDKKLSNLHSLPVPVPYCLTETDKYYGVRPSYEAKQTEKKLVFTSVKHKKLRILMTTFWDYPAVGGLQSYISTLKAGLEKLGHVVDVISPNQFPKDVSKELNKKIVQETKQFYSNRYGCYSDKIIKENRRLICYEIILRKMNLEKYDLFHAQDRFTATILGRLKQDYQKPLLFTPHGFMTQRKVNLGLIERGSVEEAFFLSLDKNAVESSDHIITLCDAFQPVLKKLGARVDQMTTIYTGIEFESKNKRKIKKTAEDKIIITCVSRLRPRKGHKYLFEALSLMESKFKNVDVWIVGEGEMREELESQVKVLQLKNVTFLGERNDIPKLLSKSDIFVLPTTSDTLPIAIIEAMFAGKAILTTNQGGIEEIIKDCHSGLIAASGNSQQLARKLLHLVEDLSLREVLAQNARAFAEKHLSGENMVKKIDGIYQTFNVKEEK